MATLASSGRVVGSDLRRGRWKYRVVQILTSVSVGRRGKLRYTTRSVLPTSTSAPVVVNVPRESWT
jgi:hypothetical protein